MKLALPKSQIIRSKEDFDQLFQYGQRYSTPSYLLFTLDSDHTKFGVAVSSKIAGAVKRNRARRRTKEIIRVHQSLLPPRKKLVVMARPGVERQRHEVLVKDFLALLEKATQGK